MSILKINNQYNMKKLISLIKKSLLAGIVVLFPILILSAVYDWLYRIIIHIMKPFNILILGEPGIIANAIVILIIVIFCLLLGVLVKTKKGKFFHDIIETKILYRLPGYSFIQKTGLQLFGRKKSPFSGVALVNIFENSTLVTSFITDEHKDGSKTVFVPTGPNPTSGMIYHVKKEYVHIVDVSVEDAMRSIISCGDGSNILIEQL